MSDENKGNGQNYDSSLDDFAKALLNKKTEMQVFGGEEITEEMLSQTQKLYYEKSQNTALNKLRRVSGRPEEVLEDTTAIAAEESLPEVPKDEPETTASKTGAPVRIIPVDEQSAPKNSEKRSRRSGSRQKKEETASQTRRKRTAAAKAGSTSVGNTEEAPKSEPVKTSKPAAQKSGKTQKASKNSTPMVSAEPPAAPKKDKLPPKAASNRKKAAEQQPRTQSASKSSRRTAEQRRQAEQRRRRKNLWIMALVFVLIAIVGLGGYAYKTLVYDPANTVTAAQKTAYDKLVNYADEYDMMSDTEKREILDLSAGYNSLLDKQKTEINTYFKDHTGTTCEALIKQMEAEYKSSPESENPTYVKLNAFFTNWNSMTFDQQVQVLKMQDAYNGLPDELKTRIDELIMKETGLTFAQLIENYTTEKELRDQQQDEQTQQELEALDQDWTTMPEGDGTDDKADSSQGNSGSDRSALLEEVEANLQECYDYKAYLQGQQAAGEDVSAELSRVNDLITQNLETKQKLSR